MILSCSLPTLENRAKVRKMIAPEIVAMAPIYAPP
jgi:hypothetical protein